MSTKLHKAIESYLSQASTEHKAALAGHGDPESQATFHKNMAAHCENAMAACSKAAIADSLEKSQQDRRERASAEVVLPAGISKVAPSPPGVTAVPRAGQPTVPAKANVPPQFAKLVEMPDDEQNMAG